MAFEFIVIPVLKDNYVHVLIHSESKSAIVVDPPDPIPVVDFLESRQLQLDAILITHHHPDHIDGVPALKAVYNCPVYAPLKNKDIIYFADHYLREGDHIQVSHFSLDVWDLPGHTDGHIGYHEKDLKWFYCGDTLFSMGCGRIFDGKNRRLICEFESNENTAK